MNQGYAAVALGSLLLVGDRNFIRVDGQDLVRIGIGPDGELTLSASFEDRDGASLAMIEDNEWVSGDSRAWDLTADHGRLKLWSAARRIALEVDARTEPISLRGEMWREGARIGITPRGLDIENADVPSKMSSLGLVGMGIEVNTKTGSVGWMPYDGGGIVVSAGDGDRLKESLNAWNRLAHPGFFARR
ncbi:hypothetical protein ACFRJ9_15470 [Paenarthrobacter sp. NPDC056912]|uniref:hypothetical protein n=1 Tax=Paenarthrobacter sp. NPDC056912 TaxID=3345965 RepID=UPI003672C14F